MTVRKVLRIPAPPLAQACEPVGTIDDDARTLAQDLVDTMRAHDHCVGLAANQIGVTRQAFVMDVTGHRKARSCHGLVVLFDPEVIATRDPEPAREGCMSVPDFTGNVVRATEVTVRGRTPDGETRVVEADAFEARALLHELDHLNGRLFLDRIASAAVDLFPRRRYR